MVAWKSKQRMWSKRNGMARDHLQGSGKKVTPHHHQQHHLTDHKLISWLCNDTVHAHVYIITGRLEE